MTTPSTAVYREIQLTQGQVARVPEVWFPDLNRFSWYADWNEQTNSYYAARKGYTTDGKRCTIKMHRVILGLPYGDPRSGDHKNHDTLDNTDGNLRISPDDRGQNRNQRIRHDNTSGYKGVSFCKQTGSWKAAISVDGKRKTLGRYKTAYEAHLAYCYAAFHYYGEFCCFG